MCALLRKRDTADVPAEADPFRLLDPFLPARPRLVRVLSDIVLGEERANQPRQLVTEPTNRAEDEPRDIEILYDRRALHLLEREMLRYWTTFGN
jgi:hypothetical protein